MSPMELERFLARLQSMKQGAKIVAEGDLSLSREGLDALVDGLELLIKKKQQPERMKICYTYAIFCDDNNLQRIDASYDTQVDNLKLLMGAAQHELRNLMDKERERLLSLGRPDRPHMGDLRRTATATGGAQGGKIDMQGEQGGSGSRS